MRKIIFPTHFFLLSRPTGRQKRTNKGQCGCVITNAWNGRLSPAREIPATIISLLVEIVQNLLGHCLHSFYRGMLKFFVNVFELDIWNVVMVTDNDGRLLQFF